MRWMKRMMRVRLEVKMNWEDDPVNVRLKRANWRGKWPKRRVNGDVKVTRKMDEQENVDD